MISRSKLLEAAARVYAECGFRGATTRRIAEEAGVNEVTIFRNFGSKAALIHEAVRCHAGPSLPLPTLSDAPADPEHELLAWATAYYTYLRDAAPLIRKTMGELEERPEAAPTVSGGAPDRAAGLRQYFVAMQRHGWLDASQRPGNAQDFHAAASMLMGTLFADAMGRDMMPQLFPQPERRALTMYVRLLLRAIGFTDRQAGARRAGGRGTQPAEGGEGAAGPHPPLHRKSSRHA